MNYVQWAWGRGRVVSPTSFIPNGCGPKAGAITSMLVPDELAGVDYASCCDSHDLSYAQGGFWGLFYRKPRADLALAACLAGRFKDAAIARASRGGAMNYLRGAGTAAVGIIAAPAYAIAVTLFGWTPFTWRWRFAELRPGSLRTLASRMGRDVAG